MRAARVALGMTAGELAAKAGCTEAEIATLERTPRHDVDLALGLRIAKALGESPQYFALAKTRSMGERLVALESVVAAVNALDARVTALEREE
jgi:transcriptional regulator with XRE-family HTH domain